MVSAFGRVEQWWQRSFNRRCSLLVSCSALSASALVACGDPNGGDDGGAHPWANQTYILTLAEHTWTKPEAGDILENFVPQFLLSFGEANGDTLSVTLGTAIDSVQDPCGPTVQTTANAAVPAFALGPTSLPIQVDHKDTDKMITVNATIRNLVLSNVIPEGAAEAMGQMTAEVDLRDLYPLFTVGFGPAMSAEEACGVFEGRAVCEPCSTDQQPVCLQLLAEYLSAEPFAGTVQPIDPAVLTSAACPLRP